MPAWNIRLVPHYGLGVFFALSHQMGGAFPGEELMVCTTCMGLFLSSSRFGLLPFFVRSGKAVLRPVACDQVRGARGRGQGTETLAKA